jgi:hypothetical protein
MRRLSYPQLEALAASHSSVIERDPETDIVYLQVGRARYYASLPPVGESPTPAEVCS